MCVLWGLYLPWASLVWSGWVSVSVGVEYVSHRGSSRVVVVPVWSLGIRYVLLWSVGVPCPSGVEYMSRMGPSRVMVAR